MVAHDNLAGKTTSPTNFKIKDGRPVPDEPHIGATYDNEPKESSVPTGSVRGGTTRPTQGNSGDVEQLDNDGKVVAASPGEITRIAKEEGPNAAADALRKSKKKG